MANDTTNQIGSYAFAHQPIICRADMTELSHELLLREFNGFNITDFLEQPSLFCTHLNELIKCKAQMVKYLIIEEALEVVFINFTPNQIANPIFLECLTSFYDLGISASNIAIEVTEQNHASNTEAFYENLIIARKRGHLIVVDDFGSGVSNFKHVKRLQPNIVKIDREVLCGAIANDFCYKFLINLVHFLKQIGAKVILEGVETEVHLNIALKSGCDFMQGYYFARPKTVHSSSILFKTTQASYAIIK